MTPVAVVSLLQDDHATDMFVGMGTPPHASAGAFITKGATLPEEVPVERFAMSASPHFPWSLAFVSALAFVASLPAIPAPIPALSLGTRLGTLLYLGSLLALGSCAISAQWRENARRDKEQRERDAAARATDRRIGELIVLNGPSPELAAQRHEELSNGLRALFQEKMGRPPTTMVSGAGVSASHSRAVGVGQAITAEGFAPTGTVSNNKVVSPGAGELKIEGFAPTIVIAPLDQRIREQEQRIVRNLGYAIQHDDGTLAFPADEIPK